MFNGKVDHNGPQETHIDHVIEVINNYSVNLIMHSSGYGGAGE